MDRDRARDYINLQEPTFLKAAAKKGYICPKCGQGSTKGNGITKDQTGHYKCFDCGLYADVIELYGIAHGLPDYNNQLQEAAAYYGITLDRSGRGENQNQAKSEQYTHNRIHTNTQPEQPQDFTLFYRSAAAHLGETDYPQRRGLSADTCKRYNLGYVPEWKHPKAQNAPSSPRLIIPITRYSYLARDTRAEIPPEQEAYKKSKAKSGDRVSWTFNRAALRTSKKPVFIVEGELDALSLIEVGAEAVAIGSTAYINNFIQELQEEPPAQPLIIALDNDRAGIQATKKLAEELNAQNIPFYRYNPAGTYKDANERLIADRAGLSAAIEQAGSAEQLEEMKTQERRRAYQQNSAAAHLQAFIDGITESVNTPAIPTGFKNLDAALDGGLYEGLYICGAISSLGKTTLLTQIGDQIAQQGQDVLIFSLEMARFEIISKSISRHTLQEVLATGGDIRNAKTARGITTGARYANYNQAERELIRAAIEQYSHYSEHIYISEGIGDIGAAQIRDAVAQHISITGRKPIVIIDYLQILAPYNERGTDKQNIDKAVLELKRISRDYKTPVIAVSSFNRDNYSSAVTMEAFKESGAIEYSSDVLIGLQLAGAGKKDFDATAEKQKNPRTVELVILKNRNGKTGSKINFVYYPLFNYFKEE